MAVLDLGKVVPEKGVDYFTESDIQSIESDVVTDIKSTIKVSDLENDAGYITQNVNDLTYYTLATGTGSTIDLSINSSTYVMTLDLKNSAGTTISTDSIDLPLETMVVGATYDSTNKKIVLTLKNGETIDVPVGDLVSGLQTEITSNNKLSSDLVDDTNHTNKFVTDSEKTTWSGKQDALESGTNIKTINNTSILGSGNIEIEGGEGTLFQFDDEDDITEEYNGKIIQWVGEDVSGSGKYLKKGYFYTVTFESSLSASVKSFSSSTITNVSMFGQTFTTIYPTLGDYTLTYDGTNWNYGSDSYPNMSMLMTLGISIVGTPTSGDTITITVTSSSMKSYASTEANNKVFEVIEGTTTSSEITNAMTSGIYNDYVLNDHGYRLVYTTMGGTHTFAKTNQDGSISTKAINALDTWTTTENINALQLKTMPTASSSNVGQIAQYTGTTDANYTNGYFYKCIGSSTGEKQISSTFEPFLMASVNSQTFLQNFSDIDTYVFEYEADEGEWYYKTDDEYYTTSNLGITAYGAIQDGTKLTVVVSEVLTYSWQNINTQPESGQTIQYSTMPTASSSNVGQIVQYTGTTDSTYTNGYFYICTEDDSTYTWENLNVQPASGSSSPIHYVSVNDLTHPFIFADNEPGIYFFPTLNAIHFFKAQSSDRSVQQIVTPNPKGIYWEYHTKWTSDLANNTELARSNMTAIEGSYGTGQMKCQQHTLKKASANSGLSASSISGINMNVVTLANEQNITGKKIFTDYLPESSLTPTTNNQLVNKAYVDAQSGGGGGGVTTIDLDTYNEWHIFRPYDSQDDGIYLITNSGSNQGAIYYDTFGYEAPTYVGENEAYVLILKNYVGVNQTISWIFMPTEIVQHISKNNGNSSEYHAIYMTGYWEYPGYSSSGTLVLKLINGVQTWVAE